MKNNLNGLPRNMRRLKRDMNKGLFTPSNVAEKQAVIE